MVIFHVQLHGRAVVRVDEEETVCVSSGVNHQSQETSTTGNRTDVDLCVVFASWHRISPVGLIASCSQTILHEQYLVKSYFM